MNKLVTTTLFILVVLSSCTHYYYVANVQNVPLFKEKNEFRFSGTYGFGDYSSCAEVQTAYSITNSIGIMANYMSAKGGKASDNSNYGRGGYFDGAIGYYKPILEHGVFEIYGGVGGSNQHHQYSSGFYNYYAGTSSLSFTKLFVQPSFGFTFNGIDIAASTRICSLSFHQIENQIDRQYAQADYDKLNNISKKSYFFLEPAITFRGGWKYVKLQLQAAFTNGLNKGDLSFAEPEHISLGLYIAFAGRYK